MPGPGPASGQPFDLPADLWGRVSAASLPYDRAALRRVCRSAREGADIACRHLNVRGRLPTRSERYKGREQSLPGNPTGQEILRLLRQMPSLRSVCLRFYDGKECFEAVDTVAAVAQERGLRPRVMGPVSNNLFDVQPIWCHNLSDIQRELSVRGVVKAGAYVRLDEPMR